MFTGIVREVGVLERVDRSEAGVRLRIRADLSRDLREGDSVAVSGTCLTVAASEAGAFEAEVMNQTAGLTTLGESAAGERVNLEPSLRAGDALGGHLVQGHVDCIGEVEEVAADGFARRLRIRVPEQQRPYLAERGSVTVDGVSLTVSGLTGEGFEVSLIPETLARTTLADSTRVNVEVDAIARYVERLLGFKERSD